MTASSAAGAVGTDPPAPASGRRVWRRVAAILRPLLQALVVSFCVVVVTFFLVRAFLGDPARAKLGLNASQAQVDQLRAQWGLNRPLLSQFVDYLRGLPRGDLGTSIQGTDTKVATLIFGALRNTALLALVSMILAVLLGVAGGVWAALTRIKIVDILLRGLAMLALASPPALIGLVLIFAVAVRAGLAPVGGWGTGYPDNFRYLALPIASVTILMTPVILRVVRSRAIEVMREPHIEAARSRGMRPLRLVLRHLLPNCALPILTVVGLSAGSLLSGAVVVEAVFGVPGLGQVLLNAMNSSDFPVIQGAAMVSGVAVALCNALAEIAQRAIDPRIR